MATLPTLKQVQIELENYCSDYRNLKHKPLSTSGLYDLYPDPYSTAEYKWPEDWPHWDKAGVYVILDSQEQVIYIGKASMEGWIANRLGSYFEKDHLGMCKIKRTAWARKPRYVVVIPTENNFEAPAVEEYLITKLKPTENIIGKKPR